MIPAVLVRSETITFPTVLEIRTSGQVWARFADPNYDGNATYHVEVHATYVTEA